MACRANLRSTGVQPRDSADVNRRPSPRLSREKEEIRSRVLPHAASARRRLNSRDYVLEIVARRRYFWSSCCTGRRKSVEQRGTNSSRGRRISRRTFEWLVREALAANQTITRVSEPQRKYILERPSSRKETLGPKPSESRSPRELLASTSLETSDIPHLAGAFSILTI